jgi:hypothetical protein
MALLVCPTPVAGVVVRESMYFSVSFIQPYILVGP